MYQKCKVILLPAKENTNSTLSLFGNKLYPKLIHNESKPQHLYICGGKEIKVDDWVLWKSQIIKAENCHVLVAQKVIASTDYWTLLPKLSDSFIHKYIYNYNLGTKIEEVLVEYVSEQTYITAPESDEKLTGYVHYFKVNYDNTINIESIKESWNKEEVIALCRKAFHSGRNFNNWIEENL